MDAEWIFFVNIKSEKKDFFLLGRGMDFLEFKDFGRYKHISKDLEEGQLITLDLGVWFRLEKLNNNYSFSRKMISLFPEVNFHDLKVLRKGGETQHRAVLSKRSLTKLLESANLGSFGDDYAITINCFYINEEDSEPNATGPETPLKVVESHKKVDDNILQIDLKKSSEKNGQMARGVLTYNLLSNFTEIENILNHFNIDMADVEGLIKPTPAIPSLLVVLKKNFSEWIKEADVRRDPYLLYQPAPQSERMGRTQIWAHITLEDNQFDRRVTIEGIYKRASNEEIIHTLSYNGEVLSPPKPLTWQRTEIPNGDLVIDMRIRNEFTFIMIKGEAYKVSYAKQERNCSHCLAWDHRNFDCQKWDTDGRTLTLDFYQKWQRQVGFQEFKPSTDQQEEEPKTPPMPLDGSMTIKNVKTKKQIDEEDTTKRNEEDILDKDDANPEFLLRDFGNKYNLQGTNPKLTGTGEKKQVGSVKKKLFLEESENEKTIEKRPEKEAEENKEKTKERTPIRDTAHLAQPATETKEKDKEAEQAAEVTKEKEKEAGEDDVKNKTSVIESSQENEERSQEKEELAQVEKPELSIHGRKDEKENADDGGTTAEKKKRKHETSATKLTPESKKAHVNDEHQLLKELKKIEKEATKKDLSEVKKKVLKSRLDGFIHSNDDAIKKMKEGNRGEFEQTEAKIRSNLAERDK